MPRFFFDTYDGEQFTADTEGLDLESLEVAEQQVVRTLPAMALDTLPSGSQRQLVVAVRDESGETVLRAALSLVVERFSSSTS